jgi:hypothetical protein
MNQRTAGKGGKTLPNHGATDRTRPHAQKKSLSSEKLEIKKSSWSVHKWGGVGDGLVLGGNGSRR